MKKLLAVLAISLLVAGAVLSPAEAKVNKACKGKAAQHNKHCVTPTPSPAPRYCSPVCAPWEPCPAVIVPCPQPIPLPTAKPSGAK